MSTLFALRALLFAGECILGSALLLALAWLGARFARQASLRHLVWMTAFGASLMLPAAALVVPAKLAIARHVEALAALPAYIEESSAIAAPEPAPAAPSYEFDARDLALAAFALWLAGFAWFALRLMLGAHGVNRLRRESRPHALAPEDLPRIDAMRRECELRLSLGEAGPMTWGFVRPVILLPGAARAWPRERLQAVLLHELAHVRRRDSLTQALSHLVCAIYWMNPLAWLGARALRREAEIAADDAVLMSGMKPSAYAGELLGLASEFQSRHATLAGVSMARSSLEARVRSVLAPHQLRTGVRSMDVLKIAGAGMAAALCISLARADVVDDEAPPVPPVPPAVSSVVPPPPAPPAPPEADLPPVPDVAETPEPPEPPHHGVHVRHLRHFTPADEVRIEAEVRRAQDEVARAEPEIRKAVSAARIDEHVARALANLQPRIDAEVQRALAGARPEIRKALADAHIAERVHEALARAKPEIDAAIADAHRQMVIVRERHMKNGDIHIERDESDVDDDADTGNDQGDESNE
jgi:beta-lactamase regulating signal transducer with metallopeptidase domain